MRRSRILAVLAAVSLLVAAAGGLALAEENRPAAAQGRVEVKAGKAERARAEGHAVKPAPRDRKPHGERTVEGLLVQTADGFVLVHGRVALRVVPAEGVDLAPHALKLVVARVVARDGQWVVAAVRKTADLRLVQPPAPKADRPRPPANDQPPQQQPQPPEQGAEGGGE